MIERLGKIDVGDCVAGMRTLEEESVDLVFADPPFNIGYEYHNYVDRKACDDYIRWSEEWIGEVIRILKSDGTFWLAIGDEYAAELKVLATREKGLTCRSWVIWYYTFGVHCNSKFTRSHAHLFHFVKDPKKFTFNDAAIRVPSARQLVYADKRANPKGRVPDDTWIMPPAAPQSWILRPHDLPGGFSAESDTWYFPRVCGTFKERTGFHGCQMPEQLLGRIIRASSNEQDVVLDPFVGSGTTLAVAKKLNRRFLGFELSPQYVAEATKRLSKITIGDPLDGSERPLETVAPSHGHRRNERGARDRSASPNGSIHRTSPKRVRTSTATTGKNSESALIEAFLEASAGFSVDRLIADPELNAGFIAAVRRRSIEGDPFRWNKGLLTLRKAKRLKLNRPTRRSELDQTKIRDCEFASEIAVSQIKRRFGMSLDDVLCDPQSVAAFDALARRIAPGLEVLYYRWAALRIRKYSYDWRALGDQMRPRFPRASFRSREILSSLQGAAMPGRAGVYRLCSETGPLYIGEADNVRRWVEAAQESYDFASVSEETRVGRDAIWFDLLALDIDSLPLSPERALRGAKSLLLGRQKPKWNLPDLAA